MNWEGCLGERKKKKKVKLGDTLSQPNWNKTMVVQMRKRSGNSNSP